MLYVILFEDEQNRADMRTRHMAEHLAFLEAKAASIKSAGPLSDADTGALGPSKSQRKPKPAAPSSRIPRLGPNGSG